MLRGSHAGRHTKLSREQVEKIRKLVNDMPRALLAERFGVSKHTITEIKHGRYETKHLNRPSRAKSRANV